jgi:hypothetical protein
MARGDHRGNTEAQSGLGDILRRGCFRGSYLDRSTLLFCHLPPFFTVFLYVF